MSKLIDDNNDDPHDIDDVGRTRNNIPGSGIDDRQRLELIQLTEVRKHLKKCVLIYKSGSKANKVRYVETNDKDREMDGMILGCNYIFI